MREKLEKLKQLAKYVRLLYVEDKPALRETFTQYLSRFFVDIIVCQDGAEGLEVYQREQVGLVITDINMPNMDGLQMSRKIKAINPNQHILIVSAYQDIQNYIDSIKIGIDGYLLKPIEYDQFNFTLAKILSQIHTARENEDYKSHLEDLVRKKTAEAFQHFITDDLTGLPNRMSLEERLQKDKAQTVLLLNIDNFSSINSNFGFAVGDEVILEIVERLRKFENEAFELFRLGGDQFIFLSEQIDQEVTRQLAESIQHSFDEQALYCDGLSMRISFTFAIDSGTDKDLLRNAFLTINALRQVSKHTIGFYQADSLYEKEQKHNMFWAEKIKRLLLDDALVLHYQPILDARTHEVDKFETLCRINDENGDLLMPGQFLKPLSLSGFLPKLTQEVIAKSFAYIEGKEVKISINITDEDLNSCDFVEFIEAKRKQHKLKAEQIILEILESISTVTHSDNFNRLHRLKEMGYQVAVDDFGIENSNFSRLLGLSADFIKIDGSFIKNIVTDESSQQIVKAIVDFTHNIGAKVVAEFVHNEEVMDACVELGVDFLQGYHVGKPQPEID